MRYQTPLATLAALLLVATAVAGGVGAQTTTTTESVSAAFVYDGAAITVEAAPSQQIRGETSLPPGTRVTIRVESSDAASPFLRRLEATVAEDGTFAGTGDFSAVEPGTEFEVTARYNGTTIAEASGRVVDCTGNCTATPSQTAETTAFSTNEPGFANSIVQVQQGQRVEIPVSLGDREQVALTLGGKEVNYWLNATLIDGNADGRVVAVFDTTAAGDEGATLTAADTGDRIAITAETDLSEPLDPTENDLALYATSDHADRISIGTLVLMDGVDANTATPGSATPTAPLDDTTPATDRSIDLGGLGALSVGLILGVVGIALLLGLFRA